MTQAPSTRPRSAASRLFDIRLVIGALFIVYGVMLTISGFNLSPSQRAKANGININLWMGLAMLVLGSLFLLWMRLNPLHPTEPGAPAPADPLSDDTRL
jgi:hypothetical protein